MLRFVDLESEEELLLAGIKPLPINRMMRQAGRKANDFYTKGQFKSTHTNRNGTKIELEQRRPLNSNTMYYERGEGRANQAVTNRDTKQNLADETMERLERTQDAINNWDPIEASAKEDYNRLKGKMGPADAVELIQPIAPLDGEIKQAGSFPGV